MVRKIKTFRYKSEFKGFFILCKRFQWPFGRLILLDVDAANRTITTSASNDPEFLKKYFFESHEFSNTYSQVSPGPQFQSPQHQRQTAPHQVMPSGQVGTDSMHCNENRIRNTQTNFMLLGQFTIDYLNE